MSPSPLMSAAPTATCFNRRTTNGCCSRRCGAVKRPWLNPAGRLIGVNNLNQCFHRMQALRSRAEYSQPLFSPLKRAVMFNDDAYGRARQCARPFLRRPAWPPHGGSIMNDSNEWVERLGRRVSTVFLIGLGRFFCTVISAVTSSAGLAGDSAGSGVWFAPF